jgi:hypothetical protein
MTRLHAQPNYELVLEFQLRATGLPEGVAHYRWDGGRRHLDRAWPERRLAVEIQGGGWIGGRHTRGAGLEGDCVKACDLVAAGWTLVPVTPAMVIDGRALAYLERLLKPVDYPAGG